MRYLLTPPALLCTVLVPGAAHAVDYLSVAQAQALMFSEATEFTPVAMAFKPEQLQQLAQRAGGPARPGNWRIWRAKRGDAVLGYVVTDAVIGKFELIDYAVALSPTGDIRDVEVLSYRESHGQEVRGKAWRTQFAGKSADAPLRIGDDVQNISGATLSCTHLTDGIRRIVAMMKMVV